MKIIALHNGHDSSITAFENGVILYHWELERVLNEKHFCAYDKGNEVAEVLYKHCLPRLGWESKDIDLIVFGGKSEWAKTEFKDNVPQYTNGQAPYYAKGTIKLRNSNRQIDCYAVEHHVNHAAYAFFTSPFKSSLVYSYDGFGDDTASIAAIGYDNKLEIFYNATHEPLDYIPTNAIGLTYSYLFKVFPFLNKGKHVELSAAGKIMGLSSYGQPRCDWRETVQNILTEWMPKPERLVTLLKLNPSNLSDPMHKDTQDLAATIQDEAEILVCDIIKKLQMTALAISYARGVEFVQNLCIVGGCALNVQINTRLLKEQIIKKIYVPPACSDCGISIGAGLFVWHHILNHPRTFEFHNPYLGDPLYNHPDTIENFDEWMANNYPTIKYEKHDTEDMAILNAATSLYNNKVIAWAYGRCEIGPRSLGARNILANPCNPNMKDIVNAGIKHREFWRPYAPAGLEEEVERYWDMDHHNYYMLESPLVKNDEMAKLLPSVTHADNTGRIQSVNKDTHPQFFKLLKDFKMLKGVGVLLSTSLNDHGKPIANDLRDILNLLRDTKLDKAYIGLWEFINVKTISE